MSVTERDEDTVVDGRKRVLQAAGLVGALVLLARMVGLVREMVVRSTLGIATPEAVAFDIASRFPESIFLILAGGAIGAAFIPMFTAYFERDDEAGGWRLFSAIINLVFIVMTLVCIVAAFFTPQIVDFFAENQIEEYPQILPLTVALMRIMLLSSIIFGVSGVIMGTLNARQHFLLPALAPTIYTLGIIAGGRLWPIFSNTTPAIGFAIGTVAGAMGHLLIQLPGLKQKGARYTAVVTVRDPGVLQVLKLMAPRVLGLSFSEINRLLFVYMTDLMILGSYPALNTAFRIIILPQGIIGQALGIAAFPTMSSLAARQAYDELRQILADSLRVVLFLGLPATTLILFLREPIVTILFERGAFTAEDTTLVTWALLFLAGGLVSLTALEVIARTFYALSDTITPVVAGGVQIVLMWLLSTWLAFTVFPAYGGQSLGGLALGFSLSNLLEACLLLWLLRGRLKGIHGRILLDGFWRMMIASILMGFTMWWVLLQVVHLPILMQMIVGCFVGGLVYLFVCWGLGLKELRRFVAYGRERLNRG
ncbi:MAG: murein biosynthesis integral membrane protein MurJ [Chloroflexi bacterium]|nr:murein biosynthesis integral membrane protein MurJ [Chloroflexota bacterium]